MVNSPGLKNKILAAPDSCGVYLMRDKQGQVLYVGKANSLKKRLHSYLGKDLSDKTFALMAKVTDIEFRLSFSQEMALLLEASLIGELKPRYNISLRDNKSFPYVRISREEFPFVSITRKKKNVCGQFFGPYTNTKLLKSSLKIIRQSFPYRSCVRLPKQSCIYYKINLCPAPCIGRISCLEYNRLIDHIVMILKGKAGALISKLTKSMQTESKALNFEAAARMRDQVAVLSQILRFNPKGELEDLKNRLGLSRLPLRIEGFDISNLSGKQAVGSMVSFYNGKADKNNYRRFRIKSFAGIDDYKMLAEVVRRRYSRLIKEKKLLPDLVLIDGGKGHLLTCARQIKELGLDLALASIAKKKENIYVSRVGRNGCDYRNFPKDASALNLIRRVRDEAHRFAIRYHHLLRQKEITNV